MKTKDLNLGKEKDMSKSIIVISVVMAVLITACGDLDVTRKDAVVSFGIVSEAAPIEEYEANRWKLTAPDGNAWFFFDNMGIGMAVDAAPFIDAGLNLSMLDNVGEHNLNPGKESIYFSTPSIDMLNQNVKETALEQFEANIGSLRKYLGFHAAGDHHAIEFGNGDSFEWARDMTTNQTNDTPQDKDIVFALNPQPLIDAGVDVENIEGWSYVTLQMMGESIPKLVKAFDLG